MATIASTLTLNDRMSGTLHNVNKALTIVLNSFEAMKRSSGEAVNTTELKEARSALIGANTELDRIANGLNDIDNKQNKYNKSVQSGSGLLDGLAGKVGGLVAAYAGLQGIKKVVGLSDTQTQTTARLNMVVGDGGDAEALKQQLFESANKSRGDYQATMDAASKIGLMAKDAFKTANGGINTQELVQFSELINKQFSIAGTSSAGREAAMLQLTQAMASGVLRGEELNSIFEQAPTIIQAIADSLNVPIGSIRLMAEEGQITSTIVKEAMLGSADSINQKFETMPLTWGQVWTKIKNYGLRSIDGILKAVSGMATFFDKNKVWIIGIIGGITAALIGAKLAVMLNRIELLKASAAQAGFTGMQAAGAIASGVLSGATEVATGAQTTYNAALWACPLMGVIGLVTSLTYALVTFSDEAGTAAQATDVYGDKAKQLADTYQSSIDSISVGNEKAMIDAEKAKTLYGEIEELTKQSYRGADGQEALKTKYEELGKIIPDVSKLVGEQKDGWEALCEKVGKVVKSFYDLAQAQAYYNVYSQKMEAATKTKVESQEQLQQTNAELEEKKKKLKSTEKYINPPKEDGGLFSQYLNAYVKESPEYTKLLKEVSDLENSRKKLIALYTDADKDQDKYTKEMEEYRKKAEDFNKAYGDGNSGSNNALDEIEGDTDDISSTLKENTKYLRDAAEREAVNRFTTASVKVDMTGMTNKIDSSMDIDGVIDQLTEGFVDALSTASEGVH